MATQEQLETLAPRKSSRIRDRAVFDAKSKKNKKSKKINLDSHVNNPIWSDGDELLLLKKLVDFRFKSANESKIDWDAFYGFFGSSAGEFSKKQVLRKVKELKRKYIDHSQKLQRDNDAHFSKCSDSEAFGYSAMLWGLIDGENEPPRLKEQEEPLNGSGVAKLTENEIGLKAQQSKKDKEVMSTEKESQDYDEIATLRDAFETLISSGLSDHQKKLQLEKLMSHGTAIKRQLIAEWKAIWVEESELKIQKFQFSATLAEAAEGVTDF